MQNLSERLVIVNLYCPQRFCVGSSLEISGDIFSRMQGSDISQGCKGHALTVRQARQQKSAFPVLTLLAILRHSTFVELVCQSSREGVSNQTGKSVRALQNPF